MPTKFIISLAFNLQFITSFDIRLDLHLAHTCICFDAISFQTCACSRIKVQNFSDFFTVYRACIHDSETLQNICTSKFFNLIYIPL